MEHTYVPTYIHSTHTFLQCCSWCHVLRWALIQLTQLFVLGLITTTRPVLFPLPLELCSDGRRRVAQEPLRDGVLPVVSQTFPPACTTSPLTSSHFNISISFHQERERESGNKAMITFDTQEWISRRSSNDREKEALFVQYDCTFTSIAAKTDYRS